MGMELDDRLVTKSSTARPCPGLRAGAGVVVHAEQNAEVTVDETVGDCTFGDGQPCQEFADAEHVLIVKVPQRRDHTDFPKEPFPIDLHLPRGSFSGDCRRDRFRHAERGSRCFARRGALWAALRRCAR